MIFSNNNLILNSNMKKITIIALALISSISFSQVVHYDWPTGAGEALLSDKYQVFVTNGTDPEQQIEVIMSEADPNDLQYSFKETELTGRTFSFASLSYNTATGSGLTFRIVKTFGNTSTSAEITPKSYGITPTVTNNEVTFSINANNKFISINFDDVDNETPTEKWIKHMLTIFIDPPETGAPNPTDSGVVTYSNSLPPATLANASTIYFPPGYHNLDDYPFASIIDFEGKITLQNGQKMYLAGGAFVEGLVRRSNFNDTNQKVYGRGILSGRQYIWQDGSGNKPYGEIIELGRVAEVNGVHVMDSPLHGIVSPNNMTITNLKFLGWHANNDAIRVGQDSEIKDSFIRAVDDFFYNFDNYVHDCVLWAGHNGAVITYGWGGDSGGNTYNSGASTLENIDIINPEWTGLGNNNGLVAAQVGLDYDPFPYNNGSTLTTLRDIRIEGSIPGILNLKPRSSGSGVPEAIQVPVGNLGYLGDLLLENITVENQFAKSRIRGQANATTTGNNTFFVQDVTLTNVTIGGTELNTISAPVFFDIEASTTQNIFFDIGTGSSSSDLEIEDFSSSPNIIQLNTTIPGTGSTRGITNADIASIPAGTGQWFAADYGLSTGEFAIQSTGGNPLEYLSRVSESQFARGVGYVFNNTEGDAFGILEMSFDYTWKSPLTADRISYKVYGINDDENNGIDGYFQLTGGSGPFGDNDATNYVNGTDATEIAGTNALGVADTWSTIDYTIDSTQFEYIVIVFGGAFGNAQSNPMGLFGVDNVTVPANKVLSTEDFENKMRIVAYPNPVRNILNLKNIQGDFSYRIYNVSGQLLKSDMKQKTKSINVNELKSGIYFLEIKSSSGLFTQKLIKI